MHSIIKASFSLPVVFEFSPGILFSNGDYWTTVRKLFLKNLRDFGFGKSVMEDVIVEEVSLLSKFLKENAGLKNKLIKKHQINRRHSVKAVSIYFCVEYEFLIKIVFCLYWISNMI